MQGSVNIMIQISWKIKAAINVFAFFSASASAILFSPRLATAGMLLCVAVVNVVVWAVWACRKNPTGYQLVPG